METIRVAFRDNFHWPSKVTMAVPLKGDGGGDNKGCFQGQFSLAIKSDNGCTTERRQGEKTTRVAFRESGTVFIGHQK